MVEWSIFEHWRDGRVVDYSSLENYRTERYRGFESLSLRKGLSVKLSSFFMFSSCLFARFRFCAYLCIM